ncbi:hypothetical protein DFH06DRAFT_1318015 [Mycena polygramma]|nr:hypothetical protein DFH06DRAFT_1318015 [Mycena polygramma]
MNRHYDTAAASMALQATFVSSVDSMKNPDDKALQHLGLLDVDSLKVIVTGGQRPIWKLAAIEDGAPSETEFCFRLQGIVTKLALVPGDIQKLSTIHVLNTSQQISLTGLSCASFDQAVNGLQQVDALFARYFQSDVQASRRAHDQSMVLNASNRFLTALADEPNALNIKFQDGVDPMGRLGKFVGTEIVHTEDNVVNYFKREKDDKTGKFSYCTATPDVFRIGDIVEIEASVMAFKNKQDQVKTHCNLRLVTLIDATFSKEAEKAHMELVQMAVVPAVKLKRKQPYAGEVVEGVAGKKQNTSGATEG